MVLTLSHSCINVYDNRVKADIRFTQGISPKLCMVPARGGMDRCGEMRQSGSSRVPASRPTAALRRGAPHLGGPI